MSPKKQSSETKPASKAKVVVVKNRSARPLVLRRLILWIFMLGLLALVFGAGVLAALFYFYASDPNLPDVHSVRSYRPVAVTRLYDRHNALIGELSEERRTVVPFNRFPKHLIKAVIAAEDANFFQHRGLDYLGMMRAFFTNMRSGRYAQGGSTITQQVVKTFFLTPERTVRRKVQEVILARRLENEVSKDGILYLYLNQIYYGHGRYGVQEASRFYFDKDVDKVGLGEAAMLAGIPQSPERLSPVKYPERAKTRQTYVLNQMYKLGMIKAEQLQIEQHLPIKVSRKERPFYNEAPEFVDQIRKQLGEVIEEKDLATAGFQIYTTLDAKMQAAAREAVQWGLRSLDQRRGYRKPVAHLKGKKLAKTLERLKKTQKNFENGKSYQAIITQIDDEHEAVMVDLGTTTAKISVEEKRYNPKKQKASERFALNDLVWVQSDGQNGFHFAGGPQAALVAMDPQSGDVLAMVGAYEFLSGGFNRAVSAKRQPGSAFKPFIYAAALDSGKFTPATIIDDSPVTFGDWEPRNYDGEFRGPVRMRVALTHSINMVAAKILDNIGVEPVRKLATDLGITTPIGPDLSLSLGTSEVRPIDLAAAYSALANGGKRVEPQYLLRINKEPAKRLDPKPILRPEISFLITSLMRSVVEEGTGQPAKVLGRPLAGKTGTTNEQRDAWFAGFSPQLVAVVWVGFDDVRPLGKGETGTRAALPIWVRFMQKALAHQPKLPFAQPPGIVTVRIDPASGLLAPEGAENALEEFFLTGTEPQEVAKPDQINPETIMMQQGANP